MNTMNNEFEQGDMDWLKRIVTHPDSGGLVGELYTMDTMLSHGRAERIIAHIEWLVDELRAAQRNYERLDKLLGISIKLSDNLIVEREKLRDEGNCLWDWIHNWDAPFLEDEEWIEVHGPRIKSALERK